MFVIINSSNHTDVMINVQRITSVMENTDGCTIYFDKGNWIKTTAQFKDVVEGIEKAARTSED